MAGGARRRRHGRRPLATSQAAPDARIPMVVGQTAAVCPWYILAVCDAAACRPALGASWTRADTAGADRGDRRRCRRGRGRRHLRASLRRGDDPLHGRLVFARRRDHRRDWRRGRLVVPTMVSRQPSPDQFGRGRSKAGALRARGPCVMKMVPFGAGVLSTMGRNLSRTPNEHHSMTRLTGSESIDRLLNVSQSTNRISAGRRTRS